MAVLLEAAVAQSFNAVLITDANLADGGPRIEYCNPAFCDMTGYTQAELLGQSPRVLQGPDTDPAVLQRLRQCLLEGRYFQGATVNYRKDGTPYHVEWNISPVRDEAGQVCRFVSVQQNITARVRAEQERDLLVKALNAAHAPILITDLEARIIFVNRAFEQLTGYGADEVMGRTPELLKSGTHDLSFYEGLRAALSRGENFRATFTNRRKSGELYHAEQSIAPLRDEHGRISHYVSISKDISNIVQRERALRELANRDKLTGLLNRRAGEVELKLCQASAVEAGEPYSVILGDVDNFKQINDTYGHPVGDRVLMGVAGILADRVRATDAVVRWGGEEFLIVLPGAKAEPARDLAERIRATVANNVDPDAGQVTISFGVGAWRYGETELDLLRRVDRALYDAKAQGRNQVVLTA